VLQSPGLVENCVGLYVPLLEFNLKERWREKEEELTLEKEALENGIKNSTGAVREQWKYRLAVWQEKMTAAKKDEAAAEAALK
jgi:hypothetical protein